MPTPVNTVIGWSRNTLVLLVVLAMLFLVALAGLFLISAGALKALAAAPALGAGAIPVTALLVAILVLLVAIFVLLVFLMRCCYAGKASTPPDLAALAPLLPLVQQIPDAARDTAEALFYCGKALSVIGTNLNSTATRFRDMGTDLNNDNFNVPLPPWVDVDPGPPLNVTARPSDPFKPSALVSALEGATQQLNENLDRIEQHVAIEDVASSLTTAGKALGLIARALGSPPPPEVTA